MMVGYVITVNPVTSKTTWSGLAQSFSLDIKGAEIGTSEFVLPNFKGDTDDILAMKILDGGGYLKPDTRAAGYRPAFYYGVITAVDKDTSSGEDENSNEQFTARVQCSDHKTYVNSNYIPETTTTRSSPFAYLKAIYTRWLVEDNENGIPMKCLASNGSYYGPTFYYPSPTEASTEELMTLFGRAFSYYQIPLIVVSDTINTSAKTYLNCMFVSGQNVGTVVIDDSMLVRNAEVTERPLGDGDYNALAIGKVNTKKSTTTVTKGKGKKKKKVKKTVKTYQSVTKKMRYITTEKNIVSSITSKVRTPVKIKAVVNSDKKPKYDKIAKAELTVTPYSHEITFSVHVSHPALLRGLAEIGNTVTLLHKGKTYASYISAVKITSDSEFIEIVCGNSKSSGIGSLIDVNAKKVKGSSGSSSGSSSESSSSANLATEADIDGFF